MLLSILKILKFTCSRFDVLWSLLLSCLCLSLQVYKNHFLLKLCFSSFTLLSIYNSILIMNIRYTVSLIFLIWTPEILCLDIVDKRRWHSRKEGSSLFILVLLLFSYIFYLLTLIFIYILFILLLVVRWWLFFLTFLTLRWEWKCFKKL